MLLHLFGIYVMKERCEKRARGWSRNELNAILNLIYSSEKDLAYCFRAKAQTAWFSMQDRRRHETSGIIAKIAPSSWQSFCYSWRASVKFPMREVAWLHYSLIVSQIVNDTLRDHRWRKIFAAAFKWNNTLYLSIMSGIGNRGLFYYISALYTYIFLFS